MQDRLAADISALQQTAALKAGHDRTGGLIGLAGSAGPVGWVAK